MKRIMYVLLVCFILVGCSSASGKTDLTMDSFVEAFKSEGLEVDTVNKPLFGMIGAKDGIAFVDDSKIVIYEFDSEKSIKTAEESLPAMKDWDRKGLFVLETKNDNAKEIFNNVK